MLPMTPILDVDRYRKIHCMVVDILFTAMAGLALLLRIAEGVHEDGLQVQENKLFRFPASGLLQFGRACGVLDRLGFARLCGS